MGSPTLVSVEIYFLNKGHNMMRMLKGPKIAEPRFVAAPCLAYDLDLILFEDARLAHRPKSLKYIISRYIFKTRSRYTINDYTNYCQYSVPCRHFK